MAVDREEPQRPSERYLQAIVQSLPTGLILVDAGGIIRMVNDQAALIFRYPRESLVDMPVENLVPVDRRVRHALFRRGYAAGDSAPLPIPSVGAVRELSGLRSDGVEIPLEIGLSPVDLDTGRHVIAAITDITERKRTRSRLESAIHREEELARQLIIEQEGERRRIARELHDEIGQRLTGTIMRIGAIAASTPPADLTALMRSLVEELRQTAGAVRDVSRGLRPPLLDELGLAEALRALASSQGESSRIHIDVETSLANRLPPEVEITVYRIAQEALTNVVRHSSAASARVAVTLTEDGDRVRVEVSDDGVGFDSPAAGSGFGITSMRDRAFLLGGLLTIHGVPGEGTRIEAILPTRPLTQGP